MTIRETVADAIPTEAENMLRKSHEGNYETLYADSDGELEWHEAIDQNEYRVNTASLVRVGSGSCGCNCDWCSGPDAVVTPSDIDFEADEYDYATETMTRALNEIPIGYFDDEEAPE